MLVLLPSRLNLSKPDRNYTAPEIWLKIFAEKLTLTPISQKNNILIHKRRLGEIVLDRIAFRGQIKLRTEFVKVVERKIWHF